MSLRLCLLSCILLQALYTNQLYGQTSLEEYLTEKVSNKSFDSIAKYYWYIKQKNGKLGIINALGEWVVPPVYNELGNCSLKNPADHNIGWQNGILIVNKQGKYGAINCYGKEVLPCIYSKPPSYINGLFYVGNLQGNYLIFDRFGKAIKSSKVFNNLPSENGCILMQKNYNDDSEWSTTKSTVLVSSSGDTLLQLKKSRYIFNLLGTSEGMTAFIFYPVVQGGLGQTSGTIGFLNEQGKIVVPPIYSAKYIYGGRGMSSWEYKPAFHAGRALVFKGEQGLYIDKTGKEVLDFSQKTGKYAVYNDFNSFGYTLVNHWTEQDGKSVSHEEIIDTNGQIVLDVTNGHFGEDGLGYDDIYWKPYFFLVNNTGKTLYNAKIEQQFFIPREDSLNKYYFFSYPGYLTTCIIRRNKQTGAKDYSFIDLTGKELFPYRSATGYFDPFTETEISKEGRLLTMKNKAGETVYSCDSCGFSPILDIVENNRYRYAEAGVFYIFKGKVIQLVNYSGMILDELPVSNPKHTAFINMYSQIREYSTENQLEQIKIDVTQTELDSLYEQMPWKNKR